MKKKLVSYFLLSSFIAACASKEAPDPVQYKDESPRITTTNPKPGPDQVTEMLASELGTDLVIEISFAKGSSSLDQKARNKLENFIAKGREKGSLKEVQVVTWADKEYPSDKKEELSEKQQELANKRNETLEKYFKQKLEDIDFTAVSMAERTTFWGRLTASAGSKVKKSLQLAEIATTAGKKRGVANSSKSIILLFYSE